MRHALTNARGVIETGDEAKARQTIQETVALIDKLAGKGVIHRNTASRYQARLVKRLSKVLAAA
jgi:small subunit ribosomal protein S20